MTIGLGTVHSATAGDEHLQPTDAAQSLAPPKIVRRPRSSSFRTVGSIVDATVPHSAIAPGTFTQEGGGSVRPAVSVLGMEKWEGRILEIDEDIFTVELSPLDHNGPTVHADFRTLLLGSDQKEAAPGDLVYLTVRTIAGPFGYPYRTENVRLRRLGRWTETELNDAREKARSDWSQLEQFID